MRRATGQLEMANSVAPDQAHSFCRRSADRVMPISRVGTSTSVYRDNQGSGVPMLIVAAQPASVGTTRRSVQRTSAPVPASI